MRLLAAGGQGVPRLLTSFPRLHDAAGVARMGLGDGAFSRRLVHHELRRNGV
jgi:hypothetical protein